MASSLPSGRRIVPGAKGDRRLVRLHEAGKRGPLGRDHRRPELHRKEPGGLVGSDGELALELFCGHAVGMGRNQIGRPKPHAEALPERRAPLLTRTVAAEVRSCGGAPRPAPSVTLEHRHEAAALWAGRWERPGLLDDEGRIRNLSEHVPDLRGEVLDPDRLRQLAALDWRSLPLVEGSPRLGPPVAGIGRFSASASTTAATPRKPARHRFRTFGVLESDHRPQPPERPDRHPARLVKDGLGGRAGGGHRRRGVVRAATARSRRCRRVRRDQRRLRTLVSEGARRTIHQGQERRHVCADRPLVNHQGGDRRFAGA